VQNLRLECANDPQRTIGLEDFVTICSTIANTRVERKLPPDASWRVFHPDARILLLWDTLIRIVALYFFWYDSPSCRVHSKSTAFVLDIGQHMQQLQSVSSR